MECQRTLRCQVCPTNFNRISDFKSHVYTWEHQKKTKEVFKKDVFTGHGVFPFIKLLGPKAKCDSRTIIGLSLLTLCFSPETKILFYLCYACEEKVASDRITSHICSRDHCSNYFNYTDPDVLSFAWVPSMDMRVILQARITKEEKEKGPGQLQMLDLPENLLKKLELCTYSEVMGTLGENDKLVKLLEAVKPKRTMIQTYQRDSNRKHPLLGMQHVVECICAGSTERRYYLCTLCNLTVANHMIIKHVLSFDHIFCYFKAWHPSTLLSKECYRDYTESFASMILDFAKQAEEIHGTENSDMKQVILEPAIFKSVNFTSYAEALKELKSITKDESLIANIKPGNKLVMKEQESIKKENDKSTSNTSMEPGNKPECRTVSAEYASSYKLRCQNCSVVFETIYQYVNHLSKRTHEEMFHKSFGKAHWDHGSDQRGRIPFLGLYKYVKECLRQKNPAVGVPLVVTCVTTQDQVAPFYVCFACKDCFHESSLRQHFSSQKHLIKTLLYQNPWRLPFAWDNRLDIEGLRSMAWEEEKERGPNEMMVKVLDLPFSLFSQLVPSYPEVMKTLVLHQTLLQREVPRCETYSKLKQNERFPLLGQQFLVRHKVCVNHHEPIKTRYLCLLCKRRLSDEECCAHVFGREHITKFLDGFHPGSLNPSTDAEDMLDLAKQAANIHSISHVQVILLERPIWEPCTYSRATSILGGAKKRLGHGKLEPPIFPKKKLVPRETLKDMKKESQENIRITEESEKKTSQDSTDNNETTLKDIAVESGAKINKTHCVESGDNAGKRANKETPTPSENDSERRREVVSKTSSEIKTAGSQTVKEEKMEEPIMGKPAEETIENCQNTDKADETEMEEVRSKSSKEVLTQCTHMYKESERKRPSSMSEKSQDTCPDEEVEENMCQKIQQLTSKQQKSCLEATTTDEGESCKPSHETAKDKIQLWQYVKRKSREPVIGLSSLLECCCDERDPIYLCECCSLKILEEDIISHVTGVHHQQMYLVGLKKLPPSPVEMHLGENIRHLSALVEQDNGYGDAQVVDLDEEIYEKISKQTFKSAIETLKALQAQNNSLCSTSALSPVKPVDTLLTIQAQHEASSLTDDCQAEKMEIDDNSEDSEAQLSSATAAVCVMTETTSKTTEVPPELTEDVKMTQIKVSGEKKKTEVIPNTNTTVGQTIPGCTKATTSKPREPAYICVQTTSRATAAPNSSYSTTLKSEKASKHSKTSQTGATVKMIKTSVHSENAEASAKTVPMKNPAGSNANVAANIPTHAAPHLSTLTSTESSHTSTSQTKRSDGPPKVGLSQLISVSCNGNWQVFCQLCCVRLKQSNHILSFDHRCRYVQMKFPDLTVKPSAGELDKIVAYLAEIEKDVESQPQSIEVHNYIYTELSRLPVVEALEKVKEMLRRRDSPVASFSTADTTDVLRVVSMSPFEVSSKRTQGCSNLSLFLKVKGLDKEPIIGLGFVWECQGIPPQSTFFMCESCREVLSISDICQHVVSDKHQLKYMQSHRSQFLSFLEENILQQMKQELLKDIAFMLSEQECGIDAQVVLLRQDLYEYVRTAPFSEALKLVKKIKEEPDVFVPIITPQQKDQQPEDRQCGEDSFPTKKSIQALETDPRSDNDERQKTEDHHFKNTAVVGIKQRSILSPLDLNSVTSKADSVVSPFRTVAACQSPQDTCRTLLMPPELRPPTSQDQRPIFKLEMKETEMHPGFPSSSGVSPKTSQTTAVSPRDEYLPTRKRPAVTPLETLNPLPVKCTRVSLQPRTESSPEFTPVNNVATSTLLSPEDNNATPVSDKQDTCIYDREKVAHLFALMRDTKSEMERSTYTACPYNAGTSNSCTGRSSESGMAIGGGNGTNQVPYLATPANNSQRFNNNNDSTNRMTLMQNSNNIMAQNTPQVNMYPSVIHYDTAQALVIVAPSVVDVTAAVFHDANILQWQG